MIGRLVAALALLVSGLVVGSAAPATACSCVRLEPEAYAARTQHTFGSELVVAPITTPLDPDLVMGSVTAWLPEGTWVDVLSALVYDGGREVVMHRGLDAVPVLARAGAVLPLDAARLMADETANKEKFADLFGG